MVRLDRIYTRGGDDGTTGLLYGGDRVSKADLRTDAYGTTDEAVSALGLARASIGAITDRTEARLDPLIVRLQRELFVVGAELATGELRELPMDRPAMEFGFCLAWRRGEEPTPPVRMLLELLRADAVARGVAPADDGAVRAAK